MPLLLINLAQSLLFVGLYLLWYLAMYRGHRYWKWALLGNAGVLAGALLAHWLELAGATSFLFLLFLTFFIPMFHFATRLVIRRLWQDNYSLRTFHPVAARRADATWRFFFSRFFPSMVLLVQLLSIWNPRLLAP